MVNIPAQSELSAGFAPASALNESIPSQHIGRRLFLSGTLATIGLAATDQWIGEQIWGGTNPQVSCFSRKNSHAFPHTSWLIGPGFGVSYPQRIGQSLQPTMEQTGQIACANYGSNGIQIDDLARETARYCNVGEIDTLHMYGHSMGGMVVVELAALLRSRYKIATDLIVLDCSPNHYKDVKGDLQRFGVAILTAANYVSFHGGPATRTGLEFATRMADQKNHASTLKKIHDSLQRTHSSVISNTSLEKEADYIFGWSGKSHLKQLPDTVIAHISPDQAWRDPVVNEATSIPGWEKDCRPRKLYCVSSAETGHADPTQQPKPYNSMLGRIASAANLTTMSEVERYGLTRR